MASKEKVLVTGGTGHLGLTLTMELQQRGYVVRATVRDISNTNRNAPLNKLGVETVEADLLKPDTLEEAMKDIEGVFQVAAVYATRVKDPQKEVIDPSVIGGINVLKAAYKAQVKRVVFTSSLAAVGLNTTPDKPYTEKEWNNDVKMPYIYAKTQAERKAWEFVKENDLNLVTINPSGIFGPNLYRITPSTMIFEEIVRNKLPAILPSQWNLVDVRDVAIAHALAYEKEKAAGRYLCGTEVFSLREIFEKIHAEFPEVKIPKRQLSPFLFRLYAFFSRQVTMEEANFLINCVQHIDTTKIRNELGWKPRPVEESLKDTVKWIKSGFLSEN
jgi:dihydroflavonol-4-reductase